ncbi:MAG: isochorismatase family protein [Candidatus Woesearchaeota archaeon]
MNNTTQKSLSKKFYRYYTTSSLPYKGLAVMLVHMQEKFISDIHEEDEQRLYRTHSSVIQELCIENYVPLINVLYYRYGPVAYSLREHIKTAPLVQPIIKKSTNAFMNNNRLNNILEQLEITTLFGMGIYASGCLISTVKGAKDNSYKVITAGDVMADSCHVSCKYDMATYNNMLKSQYTDKGIAYYDSYMQFLSDLKSPLSDSIFQ